MTNINSVSIFTLQYKNQTISVYSAAGIQVPTKVTTALSSNDDTGDDVVTVMMSLCKVTTSLSSNGDTGGDVVTVMISLCKVTTALSSSGDTGGDVVTVMMSLCKLTTALSSSDDREMSKAKSHYYENMVSTNSATPKQLWECINKILHRRPAPSLPTHASIKSLCNSFESF